MATTQIKIYFKENSWLAYLAAAKLQTKNGLCIVFGRTLHLNKLTRQEIIQNKNLLRHEVKHVLQWRKHNYLIFPILYLWYSIIYGYFNNPFEKEAREAETDDHLLEQFIYKES